MELKLSQEFLTENDCYQAGRKIVPKGIMVHSTGVAQPDPQVFIRRWNKPGVEVCVHAFVARDEVIQTLPWNWRGWHAGSGKNGSANNTHISFEICEDGLKDRNYFDLVYREAVELTAYLCREYGLDPLEDGVVICHQEGARRGIASNHADVLHWFPMHGMTMDDFRADVAQEMEAETVTYEQWLEYMERYRREMAAEKPAMPELLEEAVELGLTDGSRPRDLMTREEGAIMARAAAKAR